MTDEEIRELDRRTSIDQTRILEKLDHISKSVEDVRGIAIESYRALRGHNSHVGLVSEVKSVRDAQMEIKSSIKAINHVINGNPLDKEDNGISGDQKKIESRLTEHIKEHKKKEEREVDQDIWTKRLLIGVVLSFLVDIAMFFILA